MKKGIEEKKKVRKKERMIEGRKEERQNEWKIKSETKIERM